MDRKLHKNTCCGYLGLIGVEWGAAGNGDIPGTCWGLVDKLFGVLKGILVPGGLGYKFCIWGVKGGPLSLELLTLEKTPGEGLVPIFCNPRDEFEGPVKTRFQQLCYILFSKCLL